MSESYKRKIVNAFDHACHYDEFASIQKIVAKKLADRIADLYRDPMVQKPLSILEIGCGTGFLTQYLLDQFPDAHFVITDVSSQMVLRAQEKFIHMDRDLSFLVMDGENPELHEQYDLICSSLAVQWFTNLSAGIRNLVECLAPNGYFVCSALAEETFKEWRLAYEWYGYPCSLQHYPNLSVLENYWPDTGYGQWNVETVIDHIRNGLDFMRELHAIGASVPSRFSHSLSWMQFKNVIAYFNHHYGYCTYQLAFGVFRRFSAKGFFVTGTDTDVGKTFVSACLTKLLRAIYWKPIQTGLNSDQGDTETIRNLIEWPERKILHPVIQLQAPLSPEDAAILENRIINLDFLRDMSLDPKNTYIVEGAGGVFVPIHEEQFMFHVMKGVNLPVIIVARTKLGTLNHTLMTIDVLRKRGIPIAGVILNGKLNNANRQAIIRHGKIRILGEIPDFLSISLKEIDKAMEYVSLNGERWKRG